MGWVNQQVCKILVAYKIDTPYYVCIDSKNFFFKYTEIDNLKQTQQETIQWMDSWLLNWTKKMCSQFDVEFTKTYKFKLTQNITPFVLDTTMVKSLVEHFGSKKDFFDNFFELKLPSNSVSPSEFVMYDIWCKSQHYVNKETTVQNSATIWNHAYDYSEQHNTTFYEMVLLSYDHFGITVTGLHSSLKGKFTISDCVHFLNKIHCRKFLPTSVDYPF